MRDKLGSAVWRLAIFVVVCVLGLFALLAIFAQLRFQKESTYQAEFTNITGLENGNFVRIAGVEVGKVKHISLKHDATVVVAFTADPSVILTEGSRAAIRYDNLIGGRYLSLEEGAGGVEQLHPETPSRSATPTRRWISTPWWAGSGRCSRRWIPSR
jgi:phospholipid/cholesterol/gamma-HCH transport system substrate-binding protein